LAQKQFQEWTVEPQISPLRSFGAPVEMTKGTRRFQQQSLRNKTRFSSP
jgi:hypothetical protein